jgi:hypothetical protein
VGSATIKFFEDENIDEKRPVYDTGEDPEALHKIYSLL